MHEVIGSIPTVSTKQKGALGAFLFSGQNGENQRKIVKPEKENRYVKQNAKGKKKMIRNLLLSLRDKNDPNCPCQQKSPFVL